MVVFCPSSRTEFRSKLKGINSRPVFPTFFSLTSISDFCSTTGTSDPTKPSLKSDTEGEEEEELDADEDLDRTVGSLLDTQVKSKPKFSDLVKATCRERLPKKLDKKTEDGGEPFLRKTDSESRFNLLQILQKRGNLR